MINNTELFSYDIIILAGQSNAEGNGIRTAEDREIINENVYQLVDKNPARVYENEKGETILDIKMPTETVLEIAHDRKAGDTLYMTDFARTFAEKYIGSGYLANGRKILIVKAAIGGTGFAKKQWGVGNPLSDRLFIMVDKALSLNKDNRIVAFLWHQGEHDAFENANFTTQEKYDFYYNNYTEQIKNIREHYKGYDFPVIAGEFVNDWASKNKFQCDAVEKATKDACLKIGNAAVVSSEGLLSNDQKIHNGDDIHFCAESLYELGERYYAQFSNLINKNTI